MLTAAVKQLLHALATNSWTWRWIDKDSTQLSPAELDGVVTTDERWDASRDVMHHLEGESTISEENTTESESMTRTNYSKIALTTFLYQLDL